MAAVSPKVDAAPELEAAAHAAGIASPRPVPGNNGRWLCTMGGRTFRCHEWVDGHQLTSSPSERDAHQAGELLGQLHQLDLPWQAVSMTEPNAWGEPHWHMLTERAAALGLPWSTKLSQVIEPILAIEEKARLWAARPHRWIGSHRDARPDNTLRVAGQIVLVDWDNAGPVVAGREVAKVLRWWAPHEARFLGGYSSVAGTVDLDEGTGEDGGLLWWLELNVRLALDELLDVRPTTCCRCADPRPVQPWPVVARRENELGSRPSQAGTFACSGCQNGSGYSPRCSNWKLAPTRALMTSASVHCHSTASTPGCSAYRSIAEAGKVSFTRVWWK
jgi:hypothetical protein